MTATPSLSVLLGRDGDEIVAINDLATSILGRSAARPSASGIEAASKQ